MKLLISGEGPSDLGTCTNAQGVCWDADFAIGPMTVWLCRLLERWLHYDLSNTPGALQYVSETALAQKAKQASGRLQPLRGKHRPAETGLYYNNAKQLGLMAAALRDDEERPVMAVLFRDADGTRSAPGQLWRAKWDSIISGFKAAGFDFGVPMLPKPKSEAWLLCATRQGNHSHAALENISGNDNSPNSAKAQLDGVFGAHKSAAQLADWCQENPPDWLPLNTMPSFKTFFDRFDVVAQSIFQPANVKP